MRRETAFTLAGAALALSAAAVALLWELPNRRQSPAIPAAKHPELAGVGEGTNIGLQTPTVAASDLSGPTPDGDAARMVAEPAIQTERTAHDAAAPTGLAAADAGELVMRFPDGGEQRLPAGTYSVRDGVLTIFHPDGTIAEVGGWDGSLRQGCWEDYDTNGQRILAGSYFDGKAVGPWTAWHANGVMAAHGETFDGKFEGLRTAWDEHGVLNREISGFYVGGTKQD